MNRRSDHEERRYRAAVAIPFDSPRRRRNVRAALAAHFRSAKRPGWLPWREPTRWYSPPSSMSFLKNLFGKGAGGDADADPLAPRFDEDWHRAVRRFAIVTGYGVDRFVFNLRHPDALRFNGRCEDAIAIYSALMATAEPSPEEVPDPIADLFKRLFALETGAVPSPFFGLDIVSSLEDPEQAARFWKLGEAEFYDSPHFRMQHAYHLAASGRTREAFAKLAALAGEMPWLREAQLNLLQLFKHLDPEGGKLMADLRQQVEQKIQAEGWTTDGMRLIEIPHGG